MYTLEYHPGKYCRACDKYSNMPTLMYRDTAHQSWMRFCPTLNCGAVWSSFYAPFDFPESTEHYDALRLLMQE